MHPTEELRYFSTRKSRDPGNSRNLGNSGNSGNAGRSRHKRTSRGKPRGTSRGISRGTFSGNSRELRKGRYCYKKENHQEIQQKIPQEFQQKIPQKTQQKKSRKPTKRRTIQVFVENLGVRDRLVEVRRNDCIAHSLAEHFGMSLKSFQEMSATRHGSTVRLWKTFQQEDIRNLDVLNMY